jgi:DNA-binding CsgD family transcriptional regulator
MRRSWYTPARVKKCLWVYDALAAGYGMAALADLDDTRPDTSGAASTEPGSPRKKKRTNPEGGFESGVAIKADLDRALDALEPRMRRVLLLSYLGGYTDTEIAAGLRVSRWSVRTLKKAGVQEIALLLGWRPGATREKTIEERVAELVADQEKANEALRLVIASALQVCPATGPRGCPCPVCDEPFHYQTGAHTAPRRDADAPAAA